MKTKICTMLIALSLAVFPLAAERIGLAVIRVEPIGVSPDIARIVEEMVQGEFAKLPLFRLVERAQLGSLMEEQQLQLSGVTGAESAVRAGNVLNVQKVVFGTIGRYKTDFISYILTLRLVDVERGVVEASENTDVVSDGEIRVAVERLVARLVARVRISGRVARLDKGVVYASLGSELGVKAGDFLSVWRTTPVNDSAGKVIMQEESAVALLQVEEASEGGSRCRVLEKAGELEEGLAVRPGRVELAKTAKGAGLTVRSIPDNARVFLDEELIGVTPVAQVGIKPGLYSLEIRGSGYKPYRGRVSLAEGRTVTIERELEQVVEVEDMILLGEVPRKPLDPAIAIKKSFLPGAGLIFNGYPSSVPPLVFAMTWGLGGSAMMLAGGFENWHNYYDSVAAAYDNGMGDTSYGVMRSVAVGRWDRNMQYALLGGQLLFGLLPYVASVIDGPRTAREDYSYPTFFEVAIGGGGGFIFVKQTDDTKATSEKPVDFASYLAGVTKSYWGIAATGILEGRKFLFDFGIAVMIPNISIDFGIAYRLSSRGEFLPGLGLLYSLNLGGSMGLLPAPAMVDIAPAFTLSYRARTLEADLFISPVEYLYTLRISAPAFDVSTFGAGIRLGLDARWFFSRMVGLRLDATFKQMWNLQAIPELGGFTFSTLDQLREFEIGLGTVFRF